MLLALGACRAPNVVPAERSGAALGPKVVPLHAHGGYAYVDVRVNGEAAGRWLLDTGSNTNVIDTGVAGRLGLSAVGEGRATGIAGTQAYTRYSAASVGVGGVIVGGGDRLAGLSTRGLRRGGPPLGGLLGFNALARRVFELDQSRGTLTLDAARPTGVPEFELAFHHGLPMVHAEVAPGRWMWLLLDTGADNHVTLPAFVATDWPDALAAPQTGASRTRGIGGVNDGRAGWLKRLSVLGVSLRDVPVVFQDEPRSVFRGEPTGRIGNALLSRFVLTFDAPGGRLWAGFRPDD